MRKYRKWVALFTVLLLILPVCMPQIAANAAKKGIKRMNIVIVTDESLSMLETDPESMRYDAVKLFVQEITDTGNYLGSVSFAKEIRDTQEVKETNGKKAKKAFADAISQVECSEWTNIGGGLYKAVELLEKGDPSLDSAIIILSDGNTEMPDDESKKNSLDQKADAVEACRNKGIPIYSICLNVDGKADPGELKQISDATGGQSTEVKSADDLKDVELLYSRLLFGELAGDEGEPANIGADGTVSKEFEVPKVGVEELNIMIDGKVKDLSYTDPSGKQFKGADVEDMTIFGAEYAMTKLIKPVPGKWTLTAYGDPNTQIRLRYMYNTNFYIETRISPDKDYAINDPIRFEADICDGDGKVTDPAELQEIKAAVTVTSGDLEETIDMTLSGDHFEGTFTPKEEGTYYASIAAEGPLMTAESEDVYEISVNNATPVPPQEQLKAHANIWPILGGKAAIDLNGAATDPDGETLKYTVDSTAFKEGDYSLKDNKLTVEHYSISKGSFTIRATDPHGAYCTFDVLFTSTNIGLIMAILALLGIIAALVVLFILWRIVLGKAFMGKITVTIYEKDSYDEFQPVSQEPGRGRLPLASFGFGDRGFARNTYFEADGKHKRVKFKSKKPFYTMEAPGGTKELVIPSYGRKIVCPTKEMDMGFEIEFKSVLDNDDDGGIML